jgi:hypothetical protein
LFDVSPRIAFDVRRGGGAASRDLRYRGVMILLNRSSLLVFVGLAACGTSSSADGDPDANTSRRDAATTGPRYDVEPEPTCRGLFGRPNQASGLDTNSCQPVCTCGDGPWSPPEYSVARIEALEGWQLLEPLAPIDIDPYAAPPPAPESPGTVCGVLLEAGTAHAYRLVTYVGPRAARAAKAFVTHTGACGACSTLVDLSVYISNEDLTAPVRQCGLDNFATTKDEHVACLQKLGFTLPCAQIWYFNTINTRTHCADSCLGALGAPYHLENGSLHPCLQCDEDKSGAVFKSVAGRTRRNSGLANALCRPCSEVSRVEHVYE